MKVFDFTNGEKGDLLGNIKSAGTMGGWFVEKNEKVFRVELVNPRNVKAVAGGKSGVEWLWRNSAFNHIDGEDKPIKAEDFGVEAICFCDAEYHVRWYVGHPECESQWQWSVIGTTDWNRQACKDGILKSTYSFDVEKKGEA